MSPKNDAHVKIVSKVSEIKGEDWDACANPHPQRANPFVSHAFLRALEDSGSVGVKTGWIPRHLVLDNGEGGVAGCAPCYVKTHSQGEYVFDHSWAEAYMQAGGRYYPKLQIAVPFTPVPGPRLLVRPGTVAAANEELLATAAAEVARQNGLSTVHVTFIDKGAQERLAGLGYLVRTGQQFHWHNNGYKTFEDFLSSFASRKRKAVRKERTEALAPGIAMAAFATSRASVSRS